MKDILNYAHCIKFTFGQLDRPPHSDYEARRVEVNFVPVYDHGLENYEWHVMHNDKLLAAGDTMAQAGAMAAYELMNKSRDDVLKKRASPRNRVTLSEP